MASVNNVLLWHHFFFFKLFIEHLEDVRRQWQQSHEFSVYRWCIWECQVFQLWQEGCWNGQVSWHRFYLSNFCSRSTIHAVYMIRQKKDIILSIINRNTVHLHPIEYNTCLLAWPRHEDWALCFVQEYLVEPDLSEKEYDELVFIYLVSKMVIDL